MAVAQRLITFYRRARYLAKTEGAGVLAARVAQVAGLAPKHSRTQAAGPIQPAAGPWTRQWPWPDSVLVLSSDGVARAASLQSLGIPALLRPQGEQDAQQLVSVVYVLGRANWPSTQTLAEARRLAQPVVLELLAHDSGDGLPACDAIVVSAPRTIPMGAPVHVIRPDDGPALVQLLRSVVA